MEVLFVCVCVCPGCLLLCAATSDTHAFSCILVKTLINNNFSHCSTPKSLAQALSGSVIYLSKQFLIFQMHAKVAKLLFYRIPKVFFCIQTGDVGRLLKCT